jgi:hypothetical protein
MSRLFRVLHFGLKPMAPDKYHQIANTLNGFPALPGFAVSLSVGAVVILGVANIIFQASSPSIDPISVGDLTLKGALCAAVVVLWRALGVKDARIEAQNEQLIANSKASTEALVAFTVSNTELRRIIEHLGEGYSNRLPR